MWIISQPMMRALSESLRSLLAQGGGILGGKLLGWQTVCAVELEPYAAAVLCARQNDGVLPPFPIWDDVRSFDGNPWKGRVDIISGGFPCQDISCAGKGAGIDGARSGLWREFARIISEVRPRLVFVENSNQLIKRGLARVLGDLAAIGYDAEWEIMGADDVGAPHRRKRLWLLGVDRNANGSGERQIREFSGRTAPDSGGIRRKGALSNTDGDRRKTLDAQAGVASEAICEAPAGEPCGANCNVSDTDGQRKLQSKGCNEDKRRRSCDIREEIPNSTNEGNVRRDREPRADEQASGSRSDLRVREKEDDRRQWWSVEPDVGRVADGVAARVDRLKAIGNGQVPLVAATAFCRLLGRTVAR